MPWEQSEQDDGIPDFLRRDANNVAPYMRVKITDVNDGPALYDVIAEALSHEGSLPTTSQNWVPPWVATS